jgi:hypothetical protein
MVSAKEWFGRLLQNVYSRVLKVISPYYFLTKEGEEVSVD